MVDLCLCMNTTKIVTLFTITHVVVYYYYYILLLLLLFMYKLNIYNIITVLSYTMLLHQKRYTGTEKVRRLTSSCHRTGQQSSGIIINNDNQLFNSSSLADRARLLSISSPHASSWLSVVPSEGLGLHLNPDQFQVAIKWWLGLDTSGGWITVLLMSRHCARSIRPSCLHL